ncbi:MAG: alpha-galactosidase [Clostridia bacterium]|nr:alpha-galactosidase [Clostridia bacterium]
MSTTVEFFSLLFEIENDRISLKSLADYPVNGGFAEVTVSGENKHTHQGATMIPSSEGARLAYISHRVEGDTLEVMQRSPVVEVRTVFRGYPDTNAVSVFNEVTNITEQEITLEEVSSLVLMEVCGTAARPEDAYLTVFNQSHHGECQTVRQSLYDLGMLSGVPTGQRRISGQNVGSWSTKEALPQGILENGGRFLMFQIESNNSWYYEMANRSGQLYLWLGSACLPFGGWCKTLDAGESYRTVPVAVCVSHSLGGVLGEMTRYRRHIAGHCVADEGLPTIFNEYMHLSWDSPTAEQTARIAPAVASLGAEYYVIDCGWHNEEPGDRVYPYVGQWKESHARFPEGVRKTTDLIRSLGMKAGLWIEPEIIGIKCQEMLDYYDDDCFITRFGRKVCVMGRYFLDYRNPKVIDYMSETIRRMVEDYGADYIKLDYNEDLGIGTDKDSDSFGEGLEQCARAYLAWIDAMRVRFPQVLFETCSSGGMRMDYETLKHFSIISTSDQVHYRNYPYIAANILSAVLPEQAAVWSYPVDSFGRPGEPFEATYEWINSHISAEQVIMNMINSFLGRMHLASHVELLSEDKQDLIREGIAYFNKLSGVKGEALPYLPFGFTDFTKQAVACGLLHGDTLYLAVWNLGGGDVTVPLERAVKEASVAYPSGADTKLTVDGDKVTVAFTEEYQARFLEIRFA